MTELWEVYEYTGDTYSNFIGSVQASTREKALKKAHLIYGAPIKVKRADRTTNTVEQ